ncbi:hypothetical protein ACFFGV_09270 [Pontibacillus salicampi]|uniref:Uncharacterized protein n=1 Tax=Pontibacillus salicampi TaxID=1449801 RepID=A0ABV6LN93_9BACI
MSELTYDLDDIKYWRKKAFKYTVLVRLAGFLLFFTWALFELPLAYFIMIIGLYMIANALLKITGYDVHILKKKQTFSFLLEYERQKLGSHLFYKLRKINAIPPLVIGIIAGMGGGLLDKTVAPSIGELMKPLFLGSVSLLFFQDVMQEKNKDLQAFDTQTIQEAREQAEHDSFKRPFIWGFGGFFILFMIGLLI